MSMQTLNAIAGNATIDRVFCEQLLDPVTRDALLAEFDLDAEERAFIATIRADTLQQFAAILDEWATRRQEPPRPFVDWRANHRGDLGHFRLYPNF